MQNFANSSLEKLMARLGVTQYPTRWEKIYEEALETYQKDQNPLLHPEYYKKLHLQYGVLPDFLEIYQNAAVEVAKNKDLALFFTLLCRAMQDRSDILADIRQLEMPQAPAGQATLPYDMLTALVMLQSVPDNFKDLTRRGVPEADRDFALRAPEYCVTGGVLKGRPCLEHFDYYQRAYDCRLHRFGRLEYEFPRVVSGCYAFQNDAGEKILLADGQNFHRSGQVLGTRGFTEEEGAFTAFVEETDAAFIGYPFNKKGCGENHRVTLLKSQWRCLVKPGDPVVGIHIPSTYVHGPLTEERVEASQEQAKGVLLRCYPDYDWRAFFCHSWLVDPTVGDLVSEGSNLHSFNRRFVPFPGESCVGESVYDFVFGVDKNTPAESLPDKTTLQKQIKSWYLQGGIIRDMSGLIFR